ncbi:DUF3999 domain-containing protein [Mesorhizobium sp. M00.F.Ca.ET.151.01.1.1]|uniref:DUF3999 domain-containing protein n=1 Tax=Stenotrophomonas pavanii TaxID=487698 RepID=UPI0011366076|nr:DUF3999 domain-containing protein [Stenotrophomonas pavanii]TGR53689.1 DUF3999 domain-containing protein [bacterium M00.F.Ca.ET.199.01.1.1]TGT07610.1 DUF3999 domain-containing protein [bacterium M00.F.Ca.ET.177.01.1.1]TGT64858.1 DUF3999 domain-containing protein [Mesorhizobium sp. M00.F.Ca.ET.170.01.1.1]TGU15003.1 DUF3999 domain-containing protein [bacterium M00.F.Ca.ET.163.01.1.1]TGU97714.1 DUF3999 domain-containing protein [Mesorhizobium sp. M00.F.Ca.ET.151.01.1.1]TGV59413.1 DUF3999 doma
MRKWSRALLPAMFGMLAAVVVQAADYRTQYAEQWPLTLSSAQSGAYRIVLEPAIYRRAVSADLSDLQVFNAASQLLPSALLAPDQPLAQPPVQRELPWFALPPLADAQRNDLQLLTERDTDGRVRRVEARVGSAGAAKGHGGWLIDASMLDQQPLAALVLDWADSGQPLQAQVQVDASDDLQHWRPIGRDVPLVDLQRAGKRLLQRRLQVDGTARYLRVLAQGDSQLPSLRGVLAELPPAPATLPWEWLSLEPTTNGKGEYTFKMDGRFPVARADVASTDNSLVQWTLFSRDDEGAEWQRRSAPWIAYQVQQGTQGQRQQSAAQPLGGVHRDRYWKLVANPAETATAPTLRLGYQPEVLVFLSQGAAPYALAVGSATARRTDAPIGVLIEELRQRNDPSWQPTLARLEGSPEPLAGDAALKPQRDWKSWLLWSLLGLGVLVVGGLALSLLRQKPTPSA